MWAYTLQFYLGGKSHITPSAMAWCMKNIGKAVGSKQDVDMLVAGGTACLFIW